MGREEKILDDRMEIRLARAQRSPSSPPGFLASRGQTKSCTCKQALVRQDQKQSIKSVLTCGGGAEAFDLRPDAYKWQCTGTRPNPP